MPPETAAIFLGDGEFDGVNLQAAVPDYGWEYVCRTARNSRLTEAGVSFSFADLYVEPGDCLGLPEVRFTQEEYGPVLAVVYWPPGYQEPLYLVTNLDLPEEAAYWYAKRLRIETFFAHIGNLVKLGIINNLIKSAVIRLRLCAPSNIAT